MCQCESLYIPHRRLRWGGGVLSRTSARRQAPKPVMNAPVREQSQTINGGGHGVDHDVVLKYAEHHTRATPSERGPI